jgi:hypothetical protein
MRAKLTVHMRSRSEEETGSVSVILAANGPIRSNPGNASYRGLPSGSARRRPVVRGREVSVSVPGVLEGASEEDASALVPTSAAAARAVATAASGPCPSADAARGPARPPE